VEPAVRREPSKEALEAAESVWISYERMDPCADIKNVRRWIAEAIDKAVQAEREACAKLCEERHNGMATGHSNAAAIRARATAGARGEGGA